MCGRALGRGIGTGGELPGELDDVRDSAPCNSPPVPIPETAGGGFLFDRLLGVDMRVSVEAHFQQGAAWPATERHAGEAKSMHGRHSRLGRSAGRERILRLAAPALPMPQDAVDDARVRDEGDDLHLGAAATDHGVDLENLREQTGPCPAGLPGKVGIVLPGLSVCQGTGAGR